MPRRARTVRGRAATTTTQGHHVSGFICTNVSRAKTKLSKNEISSNVCVVSWQLNAQKTNTRMLFRFHHPPPTTHHSPILAHSVGSTGVCVQCATFPSEWMVGINNITLLTHLFAKTIVQVYISKIIRSKRFQLVRFTESLLKTKIQIEHKVLDY